MIKTYVHSFTEITLIEEFEIPHRLIWRWLEVATFLFMAM